MHPACGRCDSSLPPSHQRRKALVAVMKRGVGPPALRRFVGLFVVVFYSVSVWLVGVVVVAVGAVQWCWCARLTCRSSCVSMFVVPVGVVLSACSLLDSLAVGVGPFVVVPDDVAALVLVCSSYLLVLCVVLASASVPASGHWHVRRLTCWRSCWCGVRPVVFGARVVLVCSSYSSALCWWGRLLVVGAGNGLSSLAFRLVLACSSFVCVVACSLLSVFVVCKFVPLLMPLLFVGLG